MDENTIDIRSQAIQKHHDFLQQLRDGFEAECERITDETKVKLKELPESDKESRHAILDQQKKDLDKTLAELNAAIASANHELLETLENLDKKEDEQELNGLLESI
jgi:DNA anti-recombination protein RmuC